MKHLSTMKYINPMKYINTMKHIITMKSRTVAICAIALLCLLCAISVQADTRTYGSGEKLYFRQYPSDWSWFGSDFGTANHIYAYFYGSGGDGWSNEASIYKSGILEVTVPSGTWTHVIFTRQSSDIGPDWSRVYSGNQSEDIPLANYASYIHNFRQKDKSGEGWHWVSTTEVPTSSSTSITCHDGGGHTVACEKIDVCQQSIDAGDLFSLMPVWKSDKSDYNYVEPHVWLKWDASVNTWIPISDNWDEYTESLANVDHVYYYLWTGDKNTERFIHLNRVSCAVTCNITSFEYVKTPVNVNDSTFALEGSVAFTQAAGKLLISYGDSVLEIATPESPQVFSLKGLKADGKTDHLIAKFEDDGSCKADSVVTAPEPTSGIVSYDSKLDPSHYSPSHETYIHGTNVTLTPSVLVTDSFAWTDSNGAIKYSSRTGGDNHYTVSGFEHDTTLILYYTEFNDPPIVDDNMMGNGYYENTTTADENTTTSQYVATSDYKYTGVWGGLNSKHDVYDNGYSNENGLFGITDNANTFWKRMAHISPKKGDYLAVFDGDDDEAVAWRASTARNPHLTLQKGTTYMFSFWVANVNNYGEMINQGNKNGAVLQFKINYTDTNGDPHEAYLGEEIDLNDYMDNLWHQNSSTFTSDVDANTVTISVVDKNAAGISIGNDFALDDIRFRAVSIQSGTVRTREQFMVKYVEPKTEPVNLRVEWVTKPACGKDTCTLKVSFRYPNITMHDIKLTLKDLTIGAGSYGTLVDNVTIGKTPIVGNPDSTDYVCYFTSGTYAGAMSNAKILADGKKHSFKAQLVVKDIKDVDHGDYTNASDLQAPAIPELVIKRCEVIAPSCSGTTYNLEVDVDYTAQSGADLNYYIDDVKKNTRSIGYDVELRHLNNVSLLSLPADGKEHTLKVTTGNALDCSRIQTFTAPMANTISAFAVEPIQPDCDVVTYNLRATWTVTKPADGVYDALMIKVGTATPYEIPITALNATGENAKFDIPITYSIGAAHPTIKAYMKERGSTCYETGTYSDPTTPRMTIGEPWREDISCNEPTFTLIVPDTFIYQRGDIRMWMDSATYAKAKTGQKITITDGNRCVGVTTGDKYTVNSKDKLVTYFKFTGLSLTGTHKIYAECTGEHSCHRVPGDYAGKAFIAPVLPAAEVVFKEYGSTSCASTETSVTFDLNYTNQPAGNLEMWVDDDKAAGHMISLSSPTGFTPESTLKTLSDQTIPHVPADSLDTHKLHIKFTGTDGCVVDYDLPRAPFAPVISSVTISGNDAKVCGASDTYIPVITVNSTNHRDAVIAVSLDGETPQRKNASDATSFTFAARPATGGTLKVEAWFECKPDCKKTETFDVPTLPKASLTDISVTPVQADLNCDEDTVQMSFTLHYTYQDGPLTVWVDADHKAEKSFSTSEYGRLNTTEQTLDITFKNLPADGGSHTLYYKFDKSGFCNSSESPIAFPRTPMITGVTPTIPPKIECVDNDYTAKFAVDFKWTADEVLVLEYKDKTGTVKYDEQSLSGKSSYTFSITMDKKDGYTSDTVYVYFKGSDFADCQHSLTHRYIFDTPSSSSVEGNFEATVTDRSTCKTLLYDVSGSVSFTDADGDLVIECEGQTPIVKDEGTYSSPVSYKFEGLTAEATDKTIVAYFSNQSDCKSHSKKYSSPTVPDYTISGLSFSAPVCNDTLCDLSFTITHTKQAGTLRYWVDNLDKKSVTVTKASEPTPLDLTFEGVRADSLTHVLHTQFEGSDGQLCDEERPTNTPEAPYSPLVKDISSEMTYAPCNANTYTQTVTFTVGNSQNKKVTITCKGQPFTVVSHDGVNVVNIPNVPRTLSNTTDDYFEIYFPSADICTSRRKQSFTELPKPEVVDITIPTDQGNIRCETAEYALVATIRYTNLNNKPKVWLDDNESAAVTLDATLKSADTLTIAVSGITVPTDGKTHTLHVKADGWTSLCPLTKDFTAIWRPEISTVEHKKNKDYVYCGETYADTVIVKYKRGNGKKILVAYEDEDVPQTPVESAATASGDGTIRIVLTGLHDATATSHAVSVYFDQVDSCAEASSFIEPTTLAITPGFIVTPDAKACGGTAYTVSGTVVANHAGESIIVKYDDSHYTTVTASTTGTSFTISGVDAIGSGNKLTAYYAGHETCSKVFSDDFTAPVMPVIDTLHVAYSAPECNVTTTDLIFELNYTKQKGDLKLYINGTETAYTILEGSPIVTDNDAEKTLKIKIASLTADSTKRTLRVQFTGTNSCDKEYVLPAAPFSPRITDQTATMSDIVCGSDKYTLNVTFTATNSLGKKVTIRFKGNDYVRTTADGSNTFSFPNITRETVTPNDQEVQIFYTDATYCTTPVKTSYVETPVPTLGITIADNQGDVACDAADYILKGAIDYVYLDQYPKVQLGSGTIYDLGSDAYKDLVSLNNTALQHFDISKLEISVPADSSAQTLKVSAEGRAEACGTISESFKTIWRPQAGTVTFDRPNMVHCDEPYDLKVTVPYTRGVSGKKIYAECSDNGTPKSAYATLANGAGTAIITLSGLTETGDANHAITLYFEGRKVSCPIKSYTYDEPTRKVLSAFTVTAVGKECESDAYSLTGSIKSNVAGESVTIWYDDDHKTTVTSVVGLKEFTIPTNFNTTGNDLLIKAYFTDHNDELCSQVATKFDTPVKPVISIDNAKYGDPDCANSPTTTTLTFDLNYTMQSGTLTVWVDDNIGKHEETYSNTTPKVEQTKTGITVSGIPADGKSHTLYVNFDGDKSCHNKSFDIGKAPFSPKVSGITAEMQEVKCGVNTYKLKIDFNVENSQGAQATIHVKGKDYPLDTHDGANTFTTPVLSRETTTPNNQTVQISFASATHCKTPAEYTYVELPATSLGITIAADQGFVNCEAETYTLQGTIDYTYLNELPEFWLDDNTPIALTESQVDLLETATKHVDLADLSILVPADGQKHHLYVKADGWAADCGTIDEEFTSVWRPQISAVRPTRSKDYVHCDEPYSVTLEIDYSRGVVGKKLHASSIDKSSTIPNEATLDAISGTATITLNGLMEQGNSAHELTLYFDGLETTCPISDYKYAEPTTIVVTEFTADEQPKDCNDVNYTVAGTIKTNFATDAKIIISDGFGNETAPLAASTTGTLYSLEVSGNDLTGTNNHLTATFVGHTACQATSDDFDEPAKPEATVVSVTPKQPDCDVTTYELEFAISYTYQHGNVKVWVDDHKAEQEFTIAMADRGQTAAKTITGKLEGTDLVADGSIGHVLHFQFLGEHPCDGSQEGTFTAPRTPLITDIAVTRPDRILCADEHYDATIKVTTRYVDGEKVIVKYTDGASVSQETVAYTVHSSGSVEIPVTFDKKDGVSHETIYAYFEGANFTTCQDTEGHKKEFSTPSSSAINDFVVTVHDQTTCDNLLYSLSGTITYGGSASGDMIISFDDIHTKDTIIPMANCDPVGTPFTLSGLTKPVSSYAISAHFNGETCTSHSQEFNSPVVPTVEIANANYSAPACNETTTNLTFDVIYTKQDGGLHVSVDGDEKTYTIKSGDTPSLSDDAQTVTLVISDLLADESKRSLQVWFDGERSCDESFNKMFTYPQVPQAPFSPKILTTEAKMENIVCDDDTYTLDVTFTVENGLNKEASLVFRGGTPMSVNTTDGTTYHTSFTVTRSFDDPTDDFVEVYFADNTDCTTPTRIEYTETPKPIASVVNVKANQPDCDVTTFTIDFELSYTYQHGDVTVWVDDDEKAKQTFTIEKGETTPKTLAETLSGSDLVADGSTSHVLHFQFAGDYACDGSQVGTFDFPITPLITSVKVDDVPPYVPGETGTYNPTVTVEYIRAQGKRIVLEYLDKDDQVQIVYSNNTVSGDGSYKFDNLTFDDITKGDRVVHAYFEGSDCKSGKGADFNHDGEYKAPTNCSITFETLDITNTSSCDALLYDLTGKVSFVGTTVGDLIVEFDADHKDTIPEADCVAGEMIPFEITDIDVNIPVGGKQLTAYFSNLSSNTSTSDAVLEPVIPTINVVNAEYTKPECGVTTTSLTFELNYIRQQGTLHLYLDEVEHDFEILTGSPLTFSDVEQSATITIADLSADLSVRTLRVQFDDDHSCDKPFPMPQAPFSPKVLTTDYEITDVVCDDETYTLTVSFTVENSQNKDATLSLRGTGAAVTANTTDGVTYTYTFTDVTRTFDDTSDDFVEVSFAASDADCSATPMLIPFTEKPKPVASVVSVDPVQPHCDSATFVLNFELSYTYQHGDVTVWVDDDKKAMKTFTIDPANYDQTAALPFIGQLSGTDLVADGSEDHVLHFLFAGDHACGGESTLFDFPNTPLIDTIIISDVPDLVPGEDGTYQPTIKVAYKRAKGQKIILEYFDKDNVAHRDTSSVLTLDKDTCTFSGMDFNDVAVAGDRKVNAYFEGAAFDDCHEGGTHTATYRAPSNSSIEFITSELINTSTCDKLRYDLKGTVQFVGSAVGDLIVILDGTTFSTSIPEAQCTPNTPLPFEIKNVTAAIPAEGKQLKAYFAGIPGNPAYSTEVHHQPVIPTIKVEHATYATPQCNESVTSLTFDLKYIKQQGNLRLHLDGVECDYTIQTGAPLSLDDETEQTATIVINNLPANLSVRDLWVWFDGATGCSKDFTMPQAPYSPKVTSAKAEISDVNCVDDTYTLNVSFTIENSLGKSATLAFRGTPVVVTSEDGIHYAHSFTDVLRTLDDTSDDVVEVSFDGNDADCSGALYSIAYTETPKPAISLTLAADQGTTTCGDRTYRLQGEIRYTYLDQTPEIWLDEEAHRAITVQTMQADEQVIDLADLGINVPADGRGHHVYIKPNGWTDACAIDVPFNALQQPIITAAEVSGVPAFISCGETYPATVTVDYEHAFGKTITVACTDNGSIQTYTSAAITDNDGQTVITLPSLSDHDGLAALSIYIDDETCAYTSASITQPKLNTIAGGFAVNVSTTPCGVVDYAVWGTVTFNNAAGLGDLIVKTEYGVQAAITNQTATSADFRIEHYTVEGAAMQLTAYFSNWSDCKVQSDYFSSPDVPDLTLDGTAVDTVFTCGDKSYTVRVAFTPTNQSGTGYVLDSIANGAVRTVEMINATATAAQFIIARPAKAEQHFVVVRYPATGCEVISEALDINTYTKPKPLISLTAIDRLCNNETELRLPLVITQGDIDEAALTLTNNKGEKVITAADMLINAAHDTLSYDLPSQLAAGKYTATVEARDTLGCETSAAQSVEFAIDGVVFSKWTDVLLVDNEDGLFTGYQWYENDKLLEGKTDQVLYLPEGMNGKSYYCVLQTADGAIYTCVSDFGDLPRSADNPKTQSANHITVLPNRVATNGAVTVRQSLEENLHLILMSATGKRVAEYSQTDAAKLIDMPGVQGIYLLRIETESDVQTVKIVVY